jgi:hypothetical protein
MKKFILVAMCLYAGITSVWGENLEPDSPDELTRLNTQYGLVEYQKSGSVEIKVNGEAVYEPELNDQDDFGLDNMGDFKLRDEEAILFSSGPLHNIGVESELLFLILKHNQKPKILLAPIEPHKVKKVRQEQDMVYVEFDDTYGLIRSPIKLVSGNIVAEKKKLAVALKADDCLNLYEIAEEYCSAIKEDCVKSANSDHGVSGSRVAMDNFNFLSSQAAFNKQKYYESCLAWCKGNKVSYEQFKAVCNIK